MADNVPITAGSGTNIATDDVAGVHYQEVKLIDGTKEGTTAIASGNGTSTNALRVTISSDTTGVLSIDDNGGSITIDGTVTANAGTGTLGVNLDSSTVDVMLGTDFSNVLGTSSLVATDGSAALTTGLHVLGTDGVNAQIISTNATGHVNIADGGNSITIDAASLPLPTGAATETTLATVETNTDYGTVVGGGVEATALRVTIANDSTGVLTVDDGGGSLTIDGGVTINAVTPDLMLGTDFSTVYGTSNIVATDGSTALTIGFQALGTDGANAQIISTNTNGHVNIADGGNSITVDGSVSTTGTNTVGGVAAHDAAVSGNPVLSAAEARTSESAVSASGDVVRIMADLVGKLVTSPYAPTDLHWQYTGNSTGTGDNTAKAAAGAGIKNYVTDVLCSNNSATDTEVIIKDGTTEIARVPVPAGGGVVHRFAVPLRSTANALIAWASSTAVTTVYVTMTGYTGR